jgi:hypothetical protein
MPGKLLTNFRLLVGFWTKGGRNGQVPVIFIFARLANTAVDRNLIITSAFTSLRHYGSSTDGEAVGITSRR